jgi:diguanylate cyclase (GGDEF)-like protein
MVECETTERDPASSFSPEAGDAPVSKAVPSTAAAVAGAGLFAHSRLLDSVAAFTHHRDIDALDHSLALSLAELSSAHSVSLVKRAIGGTHLDSIVQCVLDEQGLYQLRVIEPNAVGPALERLNRCMEQLEVHAEMVHGMHRLTVPMLRDGRAIGALELDSHMPPASSRPLADGFARIYSNYTGLLQESERDKLTGLYNRRSLERQLQRLLEQHESTRPPGAEPEASRSAASLAGATQVWLAILDIDHFKHINDTYGHIYGDEVILLLAQQMRACFRRSDVLFRFGGEEFVILFGATDEATVHAVLERFRQRIAEYVFPQVGLVTVSIGYAHVGAHDYPASVLDRADKALYFAKNNGRNSTYGYESLSASGAVGQTMAAGTIDLF